MIANMSDLILIKIFTWFPFIFIKISKYITKIFLIIIQTHCHQYMNKNNNPKKIMLAAVACYHDHFL